MDKKRTVAEIHDLAQQRANEWTAERTASYKADPIGIYPMHKFEHACDQNYTVGPPATPIEFHGMDQSPSPYPR